DGINVLTVQMPVFLMTKFLGEAVVGQYNQTQRVLASPASVIGSAFSDVFRQRASEEFRRTGSCRRLWLRTAKRLAMVSIPIFGIVALFGPDLFAFVLGARWRQSGEFAQLLTPYFLMQFTASPLSRTLYIAERQREDLFWQIGLFIVVGGALFAFGRSGNAHQTVLAFSLAYAAMYAIYLAMSFKFSEDAAMVARLSKERADLQA
ncbi:MAG: oligosaccharide flippase family protein, partial [Fimbriimonadaceae bacterium]|nr:oligosaccharide flippase family protein [Fimbriimonadaceae bacterium]